MKSVRPWKWWVGSSLLAILCFVAYWGYQYNRHSTPERAQKAYASAVGPLLSVPFAQGVVLFTPTPGAGVSKSFTAWYMKKGFWGWHVALTSQAVNGLSPQNYNVDFEPFTIDGQTLVWGTTTTPIKQIRYDHNGTTYSCQVGKYPLVWYMALPFAQSEFQHADWTMVLPNGSTKPLFK